MVHINSTAQITKEQKSVNSTEGSFSSSFLVIIQIYVYSKSQWMNEFVDGWMNKWKTKKEKWMCVCLYVRGALNLKQRASYKESFLKWINISLWKLAEKSLQTSSLRHLYICANCIIPFCTIFFLRLSLTFDTFELIEDLDIPVKILNISKHIVSNLESISDMECKCTPCGF